jgi:hypothetical protein
LAGDGFEQFRADSFDIDRSPNTGLHCPARPDGKKRSITQNNILGLAFV